MNKPTEKHVFLFLLLTASAICFGGCSSSEEFDPNKPAGAAAGAPGAPSKPLTMEEAAARDNATK